VDITKQVVIYPGEDGWWVAECPSLPGCISQGETREQAVANIKEAIQGYVKTLEEDGLPVPDGRYSGGYSLEPGGCFRNKFNRDNRKRNGKSSWD
jgi:predicted RNase H-like HicB family nuclease